MLRTWIGTMCLLGGCVTASAVAAAKPVTVPMKDASGNDVGMVMLMKHGSGVELRVMVKGLPPGDHGIHVHAGTTCEAPDFASAKGHLNPDNKHHGFQNPEGHHAGDFPMSIVVKADGTGTAKLESKDLSLDPASAASPLGKTIVIHELADDQKSDPAGASGKRIACGVIPASM